MIDKKFRGKPTRRMIIKAVKTDNVLLILRVAICMILLRMLLVLVLDFARRKISAGKGETLIREWPVLAAFLYKGWELL